MDDAPRVPLLVHRIQLEGANPQTQALMQEASKETELAAQEANLMPAARCVPVPDGGVGCRAAPWLQVQRGRPAPPVLGSVPEEQEWVTELEVSVGMMGARVE